MSSKIRKYIKKYANKPKNRQILRGKNIFLTGD
jgi:hypothetical protein